MFTPIQKILPVTARSLGVGREVEAALICEKYRKLAPSVIHENVLQWTFPHSYRDRTLTIGVRNSAWAEQVAKQKNGLLKAINEALGAPKIEKIRITIVPPK